MIGTTLQRILDEKGTNVNELSRTIGVSAQTLYSIIKRNNMKIDFDVLLKICNALNIEVTIFYKDYVKTDPIKKPSIDFQDDERLQEILNCYYELNENGKDSLLAHAKLHTNMPEYKKCDLDAQAGVG